MCAGLAASLLRGTGFVSATGIRESGASDKRRLYSGYTLLVLALLMWAGNSIIGRLSADEDMSPLALNFWRWSCASVFFLVFFGRATWRQRRQIIAAWKFVLVFGLLSIVGFNVVFYTALQKSTVVQVTLIQSVLPVLVLLLGYVFLRQAIGLRQWWGVVFSISGAALIVLRGDPAVLKTLRLNEGDIWALISVSLWAFQAFLIRWKPGEIDIMPFMTSISLLGVVAMAPFYVIEVGQTGGLVITNTSLLFILYLGLMASFVGTTCWNEGAYRAGGSRAGYFGNLFPIFASGLAILLLGESLHWYHVASAVLVLAGIWLATVSSAGRSQ